MRACRAVTASVTAQKSDTKTIFEPPTWRPPKRPRPRFSRLVQFDGCRLCTTLRRASSRHNEMVSYASRRLQGIPTGPGRSAPDCSGGLDFGSLNLARPKASLGSRHGCGVRHGLAIRCGILSTAHLSSLRAVDLHHALGHDHRASRPSPGGTYTITRDTTAPKVSFPAPRRIHTSGHQRSDPRSRFRVGQVRVGSIRWNCLLALCAALERRPQIQICTVTVFVDGALRV